MMEQKLELVQKQIADYIKELESEEILDFCKHLQNGKMLRSRLILAIAPNHPDVIKLCAIVEMIQNASLLHDDVIDDSLLRRGNPSINALFGNKNSIMLGDVFYSKAFFELLDLDKRITKSISDCVVRLSRGEISDVMMSRAFQPDFLKYLNMIEDKTASLVASSAMSASILANLDVKKHYNYGLNLGIAFQIVDDLLDVFGDDKTLGKPAMNDYAEGKTTLPYILLYERSSPKDRQELVSYFKKQDPEISAWILAKMHEYEIFPLAQKIARDYGVLALDAIKGEERLESIARQMIFREF
ncbi:polyprenyl synthetase family protein [Helicobacter mustelae]|nr:polyprenyl synthetase family protein [Helicobacter mustelae]